MSWFRKKGKYWYFVESVDGEEVQHYIGSDKKVKKKLCKIPGEVKWKPKMRHKKTK